MGSSREIRTKIISIASTQKITRAMQMVAASKMRKAHDHMMVARPYSTKILEVISHLANAHPEFHHVFLEARDVKRIGYLIVGTDRGLCGALNMNLFRKVLLEMREHKNQKIELDFGLLGTKADSFFARIGANIVAKAPSGSGGDMHELVGTTKVMLDEFRDGKIDELYIASNEFVNTMTQRPRIERLLPITSTSTELERHFWDYIYEPDEASLLDELLDRYIQALVYERVAENFACEQSARMIAMKSATENAGDIIDKLKLDYNKARQAAITSEIAEIVGGAAAIEG